MLKNNELLLSIIVILAITTSSSFGQVTKFVKVPHKDGLSDITVQLLLDQTSRAKLDSNETSFISEKQDHEPTPVIFWHGMGDTAFGSINIDRLALQKKFPGMKVFSIQIGNNVVEDELAGYFSNVNQQVDQACAEILKNDIIKKHASFNGVGFSQGAQFLRALVQRCPFRENGIKVKNIISLGGQHQGVFGLPKCFTSIFCDYIRSFLSHEAYDEDVQEHLVQAEYWHDPVHEDDYRKKNIFLADINNENQINETYRNNLLALENLILVQFLQDEMVVPRESSLFGFYEPYQAKEILSLEESRLYKEDRLGLRQLNESGRLKMIRIPGLHLQYKMVWFIEKIASVYLNN